MTQKAEAGDARNRKLMKKFRLPYMSLARYDMLNLYPKQEEKILKITDAEMKELATDLSQSLIEEQWECSLKELLFWKTPFGRYPKRE